MNVDPPICFLLETEVLSAQEQFKLRKNREVKRKKVTEM